MPQLPRSHAHQMMFERMLPSVNLLYLSCTVLAIIDQSYISRFWTQFEAWLACQEVTAMGLQPVHSARIASQRRLKVTSPPSIVLPTTASYPSAHFLTLALTFCLAQVEGIHGAEGSGHLCDHLLQTWAKKSVADARAHLAKPDVFVTNANDKETQLGKLQGLNDLLGNLFAQEAKNDHGKKDRLFNRVDFGFRRSKTSSVLRGSRESRFQNSTARRSCDNSDANGRQSATSSLEHLMQVF